MIAIASGRTAPVCLKARSAITRPAAARSLSTANGPAFAYAPRACADWRRSGRQQSHEVNTHGRRRSRCRSGLPPAASGSAEACPSRPACCRRGATRQAAPGRKSNSRDNSSQPGALALAWPRIRAPAPGSPGACLRPVSSVRLSLCRRLSCLRRLRSRDRFGDVVLVSPGSEPGRSSSISDRSERLSAGPWVWRFARLRPSRGCVSLPL
jgi:hypothetical protein